MVNATILKFGYPATLIAETRHWLVLLRPHAVTLGSLILAARHDATAYGDLPAEAFVDQQVAIDAIETSLLSFVKYEKINYLMLMMVDPHVHYHVIPRYAGSRTFDGVEYPDAGWPGDARPAIGTPAWRDDDVADHRQAEGRRFKRTRFTGHHRMKSWTNRSTLHRTGICRARIR